MTVLDRQPGENLDFVIDLRDQPETTVAITTELSYGLGRLAASTAAAHRDPQLITDGLSLDLVI